MPTYPNSTSAIFSQWLLTNTWLVLTPAQKRLAQAVIDAYDAEITITDTQWKNFLNSFENRYKLYLMSVTLFSDTPPVVDESIFYYY